MRQKLSLIILFSVLCSLFLVLGSQCSAQETLTITTYYPSPYGSYNQLQTNSLGVGDNDADGSLDSDDVPPTTPTTGNVWIRGYVGIGTTNPTLEKLHILTPLGGVPQRFTAAAGGSAYTIQHAADNFGLFDNTAGVYKWRTTGTNLADFVINEAGGNVGIGTANPSYRLDVNGDIYCNSVIRLRSAFSGLVLSLYQYDGQALAGMGNYQGLDDGFLRLFDNLQNPDVHIQADGDSYFTGGNVGIGTTSPTDKLHLRNWGANNQVGIRFNDPTNDAYGGRVYFDDISNTFRFVTINNEVETQSIVVERTSGDVGISGDPNPGSRLTVRNGQVYIDADGVGTAMVVRGTATVDPNQGGQIQLTNTAAGVPTPTKFIRIDSLGRFQILNSAYTAPILTLDNNGNLSIPGNLYAASCCTSDVRFKENIRPLKSSLDKIIKIRGVSFNWKKDKSFLKGKHYGVIAQEMEKVFPEIVGEGPEGIKTVSYTELIPILIEAVKELKAENDSLKKEVNLLKNK